jgi:glycosyltransferase involved in cell wall biosynthesis
MGRKMNVMFVHQNMPGQFRHLIQALALDGRNRVVCVGQRPDFSLPGVGRVTYEPPPSALPPGGNPFLFPMDSAVRNGLQVARACEAVRQNGYRPDLIVAHPGWGESLYIKQVFPDVPILHYCEFFYRPHGADTNFAPDDQQDMEANCVTWTRNAPLLLALESGDWGMSPTSWQKQLHPPSMHGRISVRFDGIDTEAACPDPTADLTLPNGEILRAGDDVVTYVARSLEPYRGFPVFWRALPEVLRRRPSARVVIVGAEDVSYGKPPASGETWLKTLQAEVPLDPARVHVVGPVSYADYLRVLQVSAAHVYLTVPFVLSWSMLEAMSAGCVVIGSATPPVQEVIQDGHDGFLVDFFSPTALADKIVEVLEKGPALQPMREAARWTARSRYSLDRCLPRQIELLRAVAARQMGSIDANN